tara:strand:- start:77 stop:271 length:195 start_codon:yes stop_codon:yes gene_type:complete
MQTVLMDIIGDYRIVKTTEENFYKIIYIPLKFCCGAKYSLSAAQAHLYRQLYTVRKDRDLRLQG